MNRTKYPVQSESSFKSDLPARPQGLRRLSKRASVIGAVLSVFALAVADPTFASGAGTCTKGNFCTSFVAINAGDGGETTTYRLTGWDGKLNDNDYKNGSDVDNDAPSVRNRLKNSMGCGYQNFADQTPNPKIWSVGFNVNGWISVDARVSAFKLYKPTDGKQVSSKKCSSEY